MEDARHRNTLVAKLTGRVINIPGQFLLECLCPSCNRPQYHPPPKAECIYCGIPLNISHLKLVRSEAPAIPADPEPEGAA